MFVQNWDLIFDGLEESSTTADDIENAIIELATNPHDVYGPIIASCTTPETVSDAQKTYLTFNLPAFTTLRSLTFVLRSRDQGWSSSYDDWGTFKGAWSWFDVELWRPAKGPKPTGRDIHLAGNSWELDASKLVVKDKKYMVGSWLLQRNKHAGRMWEDFVVTWDVNVFELDDRLSAKWEVGLSVQGGLDNAVAKMERWYKGGWSPNGQFIRDLKPEDELRIVMKTSESHQGWRCEVQKCEVRAIWT
ncbi:hypothetical protein TWF730_008736 [Orbilia blumenaviensis]|uniref:Uncharacterized protein n=1 Tax=Orbilia blumenaviensis TaxID=1796055 RepID=A0AAV9V3Y3_9PEZI